MPPENKKTPDTSDVFHRSLKSSFNFAGLHAASAHLHPSYGTVIIHPYRLDVRIPFSLGVDIGMAYLVAGNLALTTDLTLVRQLKHLLRISSRKLCQHLSRSGAGVSHS